MARVSRYAHPSASPALLLTVDRFGSSVSSPEEAIDRLRRESYHLSAVDAVAGPVSARNGPTDPSPPKPRTPEKTGTFERTSHDSLSRPRGRTRDPARDRRGAGPGSEREPSGRGSNGPSLVPSPASTRREAGVNPPRTLGLGRLEPTVVPFGNGGARNRRVLRVDATGAPPHLLGRLLVGGYITGQDLVIVTAENGISESQRDEIRRTADRLLGTTVVESDENRMEVQNFVDPGKLQLPHLLLRVVRMLQAELETCRAALAGTESHPRERVDAVEDEVDRFYLLIARQLLLSLDSPHIARQIDVESHHYQMGYRLVAKVLEVTGDLIQGAASALGENLAALRQLPTTELRHFEVLFEAVEEQLGRTMDAFARVSVVDANAALDTISRTLTGESRKSDLACRTIASPSVAVAAQRVVCNLAMALEMFVIVNEVTINRSVEPETVARTGARVALEAAIPSAVPATDERDAEPSTSRARAWAEQPSSPA